MARRYIWIAAMLTLLCCCACCVAAPANTSAPARPVRPVPLTTLLIAIRRSPELESLGLVARAPAGQMANEPLTPRDFALATAVHSEQPPRGPDEVDPIELASAFEGDIVLPLSDFTQLNEDNAVIKPHKTWPGGVIRYALSPQFNTRERATIAAAVREFELKTCLRMQPVQPGAGSGDYVYVVKKEGCFSSVGRSGGLQELSLGDGCVYKGIAMHEFMHAAGFWHEQSRPDRDEHVIVHFGNIAASNQFNFQKYTWGEVQSLDEQYDIGSIMHYGRYAFALDRSRPTLTDRLNTGQEMGQRTGFSRVDISKLNKLYKCDGTTPTPPPLPPTPTGTDCGNNNKYCDYWARRGECSRNHAYMQFECRQACKLCTKETDCTDLDTNCTYWASTKECTKNPSYMLVYCRKSCSTCTSVPACEDKDENCTYWAGQQECRNNPDFMNQYCVKSCNRC